MVLVRFQIGKNGLTDGFIAGVKTAFKTADNMRISVLKSGTRDRAELDEMNNKILSALGESYTSKVIGYTIAIRKWRKAREKFKKS
jgi:RNA-binding protein YhbY